MRTRGRNLNKAMIDVYGAMYLNVKDRVTRGDAVPDCLVKTLIDTAEKEKLDWEDTCMLAAAFTLGGVHSVRRIIRITCVGILLTGRKISGMIQWFIALLPSHPEIQTRAHEELDRVIGRDQPPRAEDEARLPYVRAVIKEVSCFRYCCGSSLRTNRPTASACTPSVLDGHSTLLHRGLRVQRHVHPEGHCRYSQLLYSPPQRGTLS